MYVGTEYTIDKSKLRLPDQRIWVEVGSCQGLLGSNGRNVYLQPATQGTCFLQALSRCTKPDPLVRCHESHEGPHFCALTYSRYIYQVYYV